MKPVNMMIAALTLFAFSALSLTPAEANDKRVGGVILGGGTGAIVGHAIGRNAEATLVGATVGGVVGLIIGSELERHNSPVSRHQQVVAHSGRYDSRRYSRQPIFREYQPNRYYHHDPQKCRKVVTIKKGHHVTKRVITTVCNNSHGKKIPVHHPFGFNDRSYR